MADYAEWDKHFFVVCPIIAETEIYICTYIGMMQHLKKIEVVVVVIIILISSSGGSSSSSSSRST
jgi:hypothetical protein